MGATPSAGSAGVHVLRLFQSAVDPADVEEMRALFLDDLKAAFEAADGCLGIELIMSTDKNAGGLVEGAALSRWTSREAMNAGVESRALAEAQVRIFQLLRQEPVVRVFEVLA
ncbi:MAG TPA: antibiotic biosynthesis monooxygenase [Acidimicrobiales bacterium]|nr:antibiotic biosynthesis monooxygenase [Acidimicrobiales bacterium]